MKASRRIIIGGVVIVAAVFLFKALIGQSTDTLFSPQGTIAAQETSLIKTSVLLMLLIVVPMFIFLFTFAWKYRAGNKNAKYDPDASHGVVDEFALWLIPAILVVGLSVLAWRSVHAVDPYQPIQSNVPPITIQVVALPWKWLFIYPQQNIATVNFIEFPEQTPVHFELTADAPMSSFWIPQLGSQIYAMAAMETQLYLMASTTGEYAGKDTEINGEGYAGMTFKAKSVSESDFNNWVASVKQATSTLDKNVYAALAAPSEYNPEAFYASADPELYDSIMMQFMAPSSTESTLYPQNVMPGMQM